MNKRAWIIFGVLLLVALAGCARMVRPVPEMPQSRTILAAQTAWPMRAIRDANATQAIPPVRPTEDPLYPGRYPLAWDCNNAWLDSTWATAGTVNIDWTDYDDCFTNAANYQVTLSSGVAISQPVILDLPPQFISTGGSGTVASPYTTLYAPTWTSGYTSTFTTTVGSTTYNYRIWD